MQIIYRLKNRYSVELWNHAGAVLWSDLKPRSRTWFLEDLCPMLTCDAELRDASVARRTAEKPFPIDPVRGWGDMFLLQCCTWVGTAPATHARHSCLLPWLFLWRSGYLRATIVPPVRKMCRVHLWTTQSDRTFVVIQTWSKYISRMRSLRTMCLGCISVDAARTHKADAPVRRTFRWARLAASS
jgi:hypothetical protein